MESFNQKLLFQQVFAFLVLYNIQYFLLNVKKDRFSESVVSASEPGCTATLAPEALRLRNSYVAEYKSGLTLNHGRNKMFRPVVSRFCRSLRHT